MSSFKDRFIKLQNEKNVTMEEVADAVGSNKSSMSKYLSGRTPVKHEMLIKIANYFDVDVAYLTGETSIRKSDETIPEEYLEIFKAAEGKGISPEIIREFLKAPNIYLEIFTDVEQKNIPPEVIRDFLEFYSKHQKGE